VSGKALADIVVDQLHLIATLRAEYRGASERLSIALDELRMRDQELARSRATAQHLRDQIRQSVRTDADARQRDEVAA
jgi:hypothetical protein